MNKTLLVILIILGACGLTLGIGAMWGVGVYNQAKTLKNQYTSKDRANEAVFDNTWKKISQSAQVTEAQRAALKDIFSSHAAARTGNDTGSVMKWIKESIPNVDTTVYRNLQNIITGSRDEWTQNQIALVSIAEQYNLLMERFPSNVLLAMLGFIRIDARVITSERTAEAYRTGKDNDVSLPITK